MPRPTQVPHHGAGLTFAYRTITFFGRGFHLFLLAVRFFLTPRVIPMRPYNPAYSGLGSSAFARRYLRNLF